MNLAKKEESKENKAQSLYLLYGEEAYLIDTTVKKIKKGFGQMLLGINYIQIDETNIDTLISEIQTPPFGYEKKLIIVKEAGLFRKAKGRKSATKSENSFQNQIATFIEENLNIITQSVILVFIEKETENNELFKTIEKNGVVCKFEKLKPLQIASQLKMICNAYKVNVDDKTITKFIENCGTDMQVLINEIRKLIEYVGENGKITEKEIELLSIKELDAVIFDLTDSLGKKDITTALKTLHELIYNKEPIQKIMVTLYNHFKKLYLVLLSQKYNKNLLQSLNLKQNQTFLVSKYKNQAQSFNEKTLRKLLQELIDLDYNYKQGNIEINVGLEAILCTYCG